MASRRNGGKHPNLERMERAAGLKAIGYGWADLTRLLGIPHRTLMTWAKDQRFQAMVTEAKAEEVHLQRLARLVTVRQLEAGLKAKYTKEDAKDAAKRVLEPSGEDGAPYPLEGFRGAAFILPMQNKGLESKPMSEVLMPPAPAAPTIPPDKKGIKIPSKPPRRGKSRPRAAGPDE